MKPKLVVYGDVSLDGKLTMAPDVLLFFGDERWNALSKPGGSYEWVLSTHNPQAILEGSNSFVPSPYPAEPFPPATGDTGALYQDFLPESVVQNPANKLWFTVVDSRGRVHWVYTGEPGKEAPGSPGQHLLLLVARSTPAEYLVFLQSENVPYLVAGEEGVDLRLALEKMAAQLGVRCVLCTSPGKLGGALLRAGLVDEVNVDFFPAIIGGEDTPALFDTPALKPDEWPARLKLLSAQVLASGRVWLRYGVIRE
ncbi:MAG: dihydrofolate reductase family protein [Anaerolineae bacterium]|nr:dihydrofolate reductase family protein [Anaerolineae bacterium]